MDGILPLAMSSGGGPISVKTFIHNTTTSGSTIVQSGERYSFAIVVFSSIVYGESVKYTLSGYNTFVVAASGTIYIMLYQYNGTNIKEGAAIITSSNSQLRIDGTENYQMCAGTALFYA